MAYKTMIAIGVFTTSDYTIGICKVIVLWAIRVFASSDFPIGVCQVIVL
jgi:hypothetical protein